ncbi:Uncharacterized conserved protein [Phaffia rhodozyma]|uniref:Uncharacterized conserved protein n=1 Tax=Phaffia rhodozyma TaxID=264483 RepID=A0A0F7SHI7_PHARH|nr:Uncharacterized conserved protein [Phaffia rhodozyma]
MWRQVMCVKAVQMTNRLLGSSSTSPPTLSVATLNDEPAKTLVSTSAMAILLELASASVSVNPADQGVSPPVPIAQGRLILATASSSQGSERVLLLSIDKFHYRLYPHLTISYSPALNTYILPSAPPAYPSPITLVLPFPSNHAEEEDTLTFHTLLESYLSVIEQNQDGLKGKVVLIDESTGQVVGEMDISQDGVLSANSLGDGTGPVVVDVEGITKGNGIVVTEVPAEEMDDPLLRGASFISKHMLNGANILSNKMQAASNAYIQRATPREEPVVVSDSTRRQLERVNGAALSGKTTIKKGTSFINRNIQRGVEYTITKGSTEISNAQAKREASKSPGSISPSTSPPPIPAKPGFLSNSKVQRPLSRVLLAGDVVITSFESSSVTLIQSAGSNSSGAIEHKYGKQAGEASRLAAGSVVNVSAAFIDVKGIGRKALVKGAGKGFIKSRMHQERTKDYSDGAELDSKETQSQNQSEFGFGDLSEKLDKEQKHQAVLVEHLNDDHLKPRILQYGHAPTPSPPPPPPLPLASRPSPSPPGYSLPSHLNSRAVGAVPSPPPPLPHRKPLSSATPQSNISSPPSHTPAPFSRSQQSMSTASRNLSPPPPRHLKLSSPPPPPPHHRPRTDVPLPDRSPSAEINVGTDAGRTRQGWVRPRPPGEEEYDKINRGLGGMAL